MRLGTRFAALKHDGTVQLNHTSGVNYGGTFNNSNFLNVSPTDIKTIFSSRFTFSALDNTGKLHSWGWADFCPSPHLLADVKRVFSSSHGSAVLFNDGTVLSYGVPALTKTAADNISNIKNVYVGYNLFATLSYVGDVTVLGQRGCAREYDFN